ncbi:MAG: cation diffusion facilitator family transporter [Paracoccaceae bacterium]|jgi:ferrous-iron efflux pump FieF|nr:cation diffusion facilitator family transporter [Paracoccaceae bacterium]
MVNEADKRRLNLSAGAASVTVALTLVVLKAWALAETQALSVAATLADSGLDLLVSASGLAAIAYAARPPDEDHAFGHGSAEDLAALGQALFLLGAAAAIGGVALYRLASGGETQLHAEGSGIIVLVVSIGLTLALVAWQRHVARRTGNRVVQADSLHYVGDLVPNLGAILALWASATFGVSGVDSVVALLAAGVLAVGAVRIGRGAWDALMDRRADPALIAEIEGAAAAHPGIEGCHDLRSRMAGGRVFVDFHVEIDGALPLAEAHEIAASLKRRLLADHPQADILIHMDPARSPAAGAGRAGAGQGRKAVSAARTGRPGS